MKGAIFIALNEMIEELHGLDTWFNISDQAGVEGIYTSTDNYSDDELFKIVHRNRVKGFVNADAEFQNYTAANFDFTINDTSPSTRAFQEEVNGDIDGEY